MPRQTAGRRPRATLFHPVDLSEHLNWPRRVPKDEFWQRLAQRVRESHPHGETRPWGIPFGLASAGGPRVILTAHGKAEVVVPLGRRANFLCFLHFWEQLPAAIGAPDEGLVVGEYELRYGDGSTHIQPVRSRFEVVTAASFGPAWLAMPFHMPDTVDPAAPLNQFAVPEWANWGRLQCGLGVGDSPWDPGYGLLVYALPNPFPGKRIRSLTIRGLQESPLVVAGLTLFNGKAHPLRHLPRRTYRVKTGVAPAKVQQAQVDLGNVARVVHTDGPRGAAWLKSPYTGMAQCWGDGMVEPERGGEDLLEMLGAEDATVDVTLEGRPRPLQFSLGEAFTTGASRRGAATLEVLGNQRQWMQVTVVDGATGKPTPARVHFSGSRGEYLAPYGHHSQINDNWFEDYGADVKIAGRSFAYVPGEFTTEMPVGEVYVELSKSFEYQPVRTKVSVKPGQKALTLKIDRWKDLRREGWVTADTHVHFISPHTAWLQAQGEGVNVVNLLASQWGRLFTNSGDYTGRVGVVEDDTIVYVGTENRNHMLGHMSMLGTQGPLPVFPMCGGGPTESWVGDPDLVTLAEMARENRRKGGLVIRPHFPWCGNTEDPVPIIQGLVDALEIRYLFAPEYAVAEWYRYLNCGYRVTAVGGTDKMSAGAALGWMRTYARLDADRPFTYEAWSDAVRAGRTVTTSGPVMDLTVEGRGLGETLELPAGGGTVEVRATAECFAPIGVLELIVNGQVVALVKPPRGARRLTLTERVRVTGTAWVAARCQGRERHPSAYMYAHTSPIYINCPGPRQFDGPAMQHMLGLVEGGMEYLQTLATCFDEAARKRMIKEFKAAQRELRSRLKTEGADELHHGAGAFHTHGPGQPAHRHG